MSTVQTPRKSFTIRPTSVKDGTAIWQLVERSGALDPNSVYAYLLMAGEFGDTCLIAEHEGQPVGFVIAFRPPRKPEVVFVWQIGVDSSMRGQGLASKLLDQLVESQAAHGVRFLEATVTPGNAPSRALFSSLANRRGVPLQIQESHYPSDLFPGQSHEAEDLFRIGPFTSEG